MLIPGFERIHPIYDFLEMTILIMPVFIEKNLKPLKFSTKIAFFAKAIFIPNLKNHIKAELEKIQEFTLIFIFAIFLRK